LVVAESGESASVRPRSAAGWASRTKTSKAKKLCVSGTNVEADDLIMLARLSLALAQARRG
jgi:hypothetical protein